MRDTGDECRAAESFLRAAHLHDLHASSLASRRARHYGPLSTTARPATSRLVGRRQRRRNRTPAFGPSTVVRRDAVAAGAQSGDSARRRPEHTYGPERIVGRLPPTKVAATAKRSDVLKIGKIPLVETNPCARAGRPLRSPRNESRGSYSASITPCVETERPSTVGPARRHGERLVARTRPRVSFAQHRPDLRARCPTRFLRPERTPVRLRRLARRATR